MEIKLILGILSAIIGGVCFLPYIKDILQKKTEPHTYTWLIWTVVQTVAVLAAFKGGGGYGIWALVVGVFFCGIIFLLSLKYGTKNISKFDFYCLVAAFITLGIYLFSDNSLLAVVLVAIIDFVGFIPTFRKGWEEPETETVSTFILSALSNLLSLFALENYSLITALYVCSLLFTNSSFSLAILYKRNKNKSLKI